MESFADDEDFFVNPAQQHDTLSDSHSPQEYGAPALGSLSPCAATTGRATRYRHAATSRGTALPDPTTLSFLPLAEWDEHNGYDEDTPTRLRYSIEWKVTVNNKAVSRDTEQDVVLAPAVYWRMYLQPRVDTLVARKLPTGGQAECDDTTVVATVNDRSERDLVKRYDDMHIDWSAVERQLLRWAELFRIGKRLRVDLSFNYVEAVVATSASAARMHKRGSSATQRMLADRASQLDAEQKIGGGASVWRDVYALMRCPGPPCNQGPYCWREPFGKKHYKLRTHHLKTLIELVQQGHILNSHDDVPEDVRDQLYAEEHQRHERRSTTTSAATPSFPPITITNVMPAQSHDSPSTISASGTSVSERRDSRRASLHIPGPRDLAVMAYTDWQRSNVVDEAQQAEYQKACDVTLLEMLDLEQVHEDQDPDFYVQHGVKMGIARRFVSDIEPWVEVYKSTYNR